MDCFICKIKAGNLILKEHEAARWLTKETLGSVNWLPADWGLVEKISTLTEMNVNVRISDELKTASIIPEHK